VADEADRISQLTGRPTDRHARDVTVNLKAASDYDDSGLLYNGREYALDVVQALVAVRVDASGVELSDLNLHEPEAARGVIWTAHTKWPANITDAIRKRSREIRPDTFQVT